MFPFFRVLFFLGDKYIFRGNATKCRVNALRRVMRHLKQCKHIIVRVNFLSFEFFTTFCSVCIEFGATIARRLKPSRATAVRQGKACRAK